MIKRAIWHFNMPKKVKDILVVLKEKAEVKNCVEVQEVIDLQNKLSWNNLPTIIDDALELLGVDTERTARTLPNWVTVPSRIELLEAKVDQLDCRSLAPVLEKEEKATVEEAIEEVIEDEKNEGATEGATEGAIEEIEVVEETVVAIDVPTEEKVIVSKIKLLEYDADEDLSGDNEVVNKTVYFIDSSGDEVPNIGKKLFLDKKLTKALEGYKGAFYFTNSKSKDKVTMLVRGTGTVKRTKFKV